MSGSQLSGPVAAGGAGGGAEVDGDPAEWIAVGHGEFWECHRKTKQGSPGDHPDGGSQRREFAG